MLPIIRREVNNNQNSNQTGNAQQRSFLSQLAHSIRGVSCFSNAVHPQTVVPATPLSNLSVGKQKAALKVHNLIPKLSPMQIDFNTNNIIAGIREARAGHKGEEHLLIHTPEMSITAYDCGDLHQTTDAKTRNAQMEASLQRIMAETKGISVTVGFPYYNDQGERVIMHALISDGEIKRIKGKEELANNIGSNRGVEYEMRFFTPCAAGMKFTLFGQQYTYRAPGSLFSNEPVVVAGQRVSLVICEEMFTGTDQMGPLYLHLYHHIGHYLESSLSKALPGHYIDINETEELRSLIEQALNSDGSLVLPAKLDGFSAEEIILLNQEFAQTFAAYKKEYRALKQQFDQQIKADIREKSTLYKQLQQADVILVPNGSPSATAKLQTREALLQTIGETYAEQMGEQEKKVVFYNNNNGVQAGSIPFDGTVLKTTITKEDVSVVLLSSHKYGLVEEANPRVPVHATGRGRQEVADAINGSKLYTGNKATVAKFGKGVADVQTKYYHDADYAYSTLQTLMKLVPSLQPGEYIPKDNKTFSGFFISMSGGFDSGHTALAIGRAFEKRLRTLYLEVGQNLTKALEGLKKELLLDNRAFDADLFCSRFLTKRIDVGNDLDHPDLQYRYMEQMAEILGLGKIQVTEENLYVVLEQVKGKLAGVRTVGDLLELVKNRMESMSVKNQIPIDDQLEFLAKLLNFHLVKGAYLRTDNNSIDTENAARSLADELGLDFEVRNVDVDFKTQLLMEKGINIAEFPEKKRIQILNKYSEILRLGKKTDLEKQIMENEAKIEILKFQKGSTEEIGELEDLNAGLKEKIKINGEELAKLKGELYELVKDKVSVPKDKYKVHNWYESASGLEIENAQARMRSQKNWLMAKEYGFMPTSNPNSDEGKQGYTTVSGDQHAGYVSWTGNHRKTNIYAEMLYMMKRSMGDATRFFGEMKPIKAIYNTFKQPPSAELQQLSTDKKGKGSIQQTDESSYGMSYQELTVIGDKLFGLSDNGAYFDQMCEIYAKQFKDDPIFSGHDKWEIFAKMDKVNRQWYAASFKRRMAPWQMTNSDASVDHHANNRTEFAGIDNAIRFERAGLLLALLIDQKIIQTDMPIKELMENLLLNAELQKKLAMVIWSRGSQPNDIKDLIRLYKSCPELLKIKIRERVEKAGIDLKKDLAIKEPQIGEIENKGGSPIVGKPIAAKARDLAGNLELAKKAVVEAVQEGKKMVVIPDVVGADLGDNVRRVTQEHIAILLKDLARFKVPKDFAIVIGHPAYDQGTADRSCRYYQAASVIQNGEVKATFYANKINNNHDQPGASYDTRTFQPYQGPQNPVEINGQSYFVAIGESSVPNLAGSTKVIHLGAMEAEDQLEAAAKIGPRLELSVNAKGSSSGIRAFNGRSVYSTEEIAGFEKQDATPEAQLLRDAQWLNDYLPLFGKITIVLDSPESLYTLAVMKKVVEMRKGVCNEKNFNDAVEVVTPCFASGRGEVETLWSAAKELFGFELPRSNEKHETNIYHIDSLHYMFVRNAIVGDINMRKFDEIEQGDSWLAFDGKFRAFLDAGQTAKKEQLAEFKTLLESSKALKESIRETYRREHNDQPADENNLAAYTQLQIQLICNRIRDYRFDPESSVRVKYITSWLLSARDGDEGQIMLSNIARNDLCCAMENMVGGRMNQGGLTVTASHSLNAMKQMINQPSADALFDAKMSEEIVEGLTRRDVDEIYEYIKDHNFNIDGIENSKLKGPHLISKLEKFAELWKKNTLDRHCLPNAPHTNYSVDQQTSFREPMFAGWLDDQLRLLKEKMRLQSQQPAQPRTRRWGFRNNQVSPVF
jgi:predicted amidohydrolase/NH3-dependent NAD+ synthetase